MRQTRVPTSTSVPARPATLALGEGPSFARALWRLASADVSTGNVVHLLTDGNATFDAMLALIDSAQDEVCLESYIVSDDVVGRRFAASLGAAAARGVRVRFLTDWVGARGASPLLNEMRGLKIEVRVFNRPGWRPWLGLIPRDHRKLLVTDSAIGVTGGIGIGEQWQRGLIRKRASVWRDTCVRIAGPAALDMQAAFERMWLRAGGERPPRQALRREARGSHLDPVHCTPSLVGIVEGEPWRLRVGRSLHLQAAAAQRSIWVASAYFVPSFAEVDALTGAARDGVDVRLLVPSRYDHPWIHGLTRGFYARLLRNGVRIWEWNGEMMHAKTTVVDGHWLRVGSTDFNPLGIAINYELDAMIQDPVVAAAAEDAFERDLHHSHEVVRIPR
jgi:cardiolipin synthase